MVLAAISAESVAGYDATTGRPLELASGILSFAPLYGGPTVLIREAARRSWRTRSRRLRRLRVPPDHRRPDRPHRRRAHLFPPPAPCGSHRVGSEVGAGGRVEHQHHRRDHRPQVHDPAGREQHRPQVHRRHGIAERSPLGQPADRPDHQRQGAEPAIQHRQGDTGPTPALAQPGGQVRQPGEGQQPDGEADGDLGRRADLAGGGLDHDHGGLEQARGDGEEPQPDRGLQLGGDARPRIRPWHVGSRRMCAGSFHDDPTSGGVGRTTTTPRRDAASRRSVRVSWSASAKG
jgi:hypothetical protein